MAKQSSPLTVLFFTTHAEDAEWRNAHRLIYFGFEEVRLLAINLPDAFAVREGQLIGRYPYSRAILLMQAVDCQRSVAGQVNQRQPLGGHSS